MDCYIIIYLGLYLQYWSNNLGWTLYRNLATEFDEFPTSLPVVRNHSLVIRSEKEIDR